MTPLDQEIVAHEHVLVGYVVVADGSQTQGAAPGVRQMQSRRTRLDDRAANFPVRRLGAGRKLHQRDEIAKPRSAGDENLLAVDEPAAVWLGVAVAAGMMPPRRNAAEIGFRGAGVDPAAPSGDLAAYLGINLARPRQFIAQAPDDVERHADHQRRAGIAARETLLRNDHVEHVDALAAIFARQRQPGDNPRDAERRDFRGER